MTPVLSDKDRRALQNRQDKITSGTWATSVRAVNGVLAALAQASGLSEVRLRNPFVFNDIPAPGEYSDRKLPPREHRPPATRLITSQGVALKLYLTALFEAHTQGRPGAQPDNGRPHVGPSRAAPGWIDLIASGAEDSGGDVFLTRAEKRTRQLRDTLKRLHKDGLVFLPRLAEPGHKYEKFLLADEGGPRAAGTILRYKIPTPAEASFTLPVGLFTNGWISVLTDTELAFLLMLAFYQARSPGQEFRIRSETRLRHLGLGRDAYEAHQLFEAAGIATVTADPTQRGDGTNEDYGTDGKPLPHAFTFLPAGLDNDALTAVSQYLDHRLRS